MLPTTPNGTKFATFVFDALPEAKTTLTQEVAPEGDAVPAGPGARHDVAVGVVAQDQGLLRVAVDQGGEPPEGVALQPHGPPGGGVAAWLTDWLCAPRPTAPP